MRLSDPELLMNAIFLTLFVLMLIAQQREPKDGNHR